jgi:hypothetical protein
VPTETVGKLPLRHLKRKAGLQRQWIHCKLRANLANCQNCQIAKSGNWKISTPNRKGNRESNRNPGENDESVKTADLQSGIIDLSAHSRTISSCNEGFQKRKLLRSFLLSSKKKLMTNLFL